MLNKDKKKIFIIEDDANFLYGMQAKFSLENFNVHINNGSGEINNLLNKIKDFLPNYIVLDLLMPEIDGFAVAKEIKANPEMRNIIIFAFTNLCDNESKERGLKMGIDYYFFKKELSADELVEKILKTLANRNKKNGKN